MIDLKLLPNYKNKKRIIISIILLITLIGLIAYNFHINVKVAGDNFYKNYPNLEHMADLYQITYVEAVTDAVKYGLLQTMFLFYCYLHIVISYHFIKNYENKLKIFSIIINILIGINCILLIPVYIWENSL